ALRFGPLARLGVISYGVYLLHPLSINVARLVLGKVGIDPKSALGMPLTFVGTLVIVWTAAEISFRVFESYFLGLKERFRQRAAAPRVDGAAVGHGGDPAAGPAVVRGSRKRRNARGARGVAWGESPRLSRRSRRTWPR
ncbi:MAG: hypothetical protein IT382_13930, partial [Deltaproteobacteria bacterium]|nr:hypothetical protein [Deltaproteobacteria bacterium]